VAGRERDKSHVAGRNRKRVGWNEMRYKKLYTSFDILETSKQRRIRYDTKSK